MTTPTTPPRPPDRPRRSGWARLALPTAAVLLLVGGVVAVVLAVRGHDSGSSPSANAASTSIAPTDVSSSTSASASTPPSGQVTTPATSADPQAALKQKITAGFLAFEQMLNRELGITSGDVASLSAVATGQALANSEDSVAKLRGKGEVIHGSPLVTDVVVIEIASPTSAVVCATEDDSPTAVVDARTGAVVASGFQTYKTRTVMVLQQGAWKASVAESVASC